jgi:hypothetical protein
VVLLTVVIVIFCFSIRVFSVAAIICTILVLPVNYYGQNRIHKDIPLESLEVFTIENVKEGSRWYEQCFIFFDENGFHVSLVQIENNVQKLRK